MKLVHATLVLVLVVLLQGINGQDFLSDYLNGKVFGADPGPCPNTTHRCEGDADTSKLPVAVQNIPIKLFDGVCFGLNILGVCLGYNDGFTRPLGGPNGWIQGGEVDIYNLQCRSMSLQQLSLIVQGSPTSSVVGTRIRSFDLRQTCTGRTEFRSLKFEYSNAPIVGDIRFTLTGRGNFKTGLLHDPPVTQGVDFDFTIYWFADFLNPAVTFRDSIPSYVTIPSTQCFIATQDRLGIDFSDRQYDAVTLTIFGLSIPFGAIWTGFDIDIAFIAALEASFGITICEAMQFSAVNEQGAPGPINDYITELYDYFYNELTTGVPDDVEFVDRNLVALTQVGEYPFSFEEKKSGFPVQQDELDKSINFNDSSIFEVISVGINGFLNEEPPSRAGFPYPKAVNEVVERLLGTEVNGVVEPDVFGTAFFDLVAEGYFLSTQLSLDWARVNISLERLDFRGLNSILEFGMLENNYCNDDDDLDCDASTRLNYTLNHSFKAGDVAIGVKTRIRLLNDEWVSSSVPTPVNCIGVPDCTCPTPPFPSCTYDSTEYVFFVNLTFINFTLDASTVMAFNPDLLDELQIGQLTGIDFGGELTAGAKQISNCILPGFYTLNLPNFNISVIEITDPTATFETGNEQLGALIRNSVVAFNTLVGSAMEVELPQFAQSDSVRGQMNAFLFDEIDLASLNRCDPYVEPPTNDALNFETGAISYFYPVINRVVGGSYITTRDTDTDINDIVQIIMEYYSELFDDFIFKPSDPVVQGVWLSKDEFADFASFEAYTDFGPVDRNFINVGNIEMYNVNQVEAMLVEVFGETQNGIQFKLNISNTTNDADGDPATTGDTIPNLNNFNASFDLNVYALNNYDDYNTRDPVPINDRIKVTLVLKDIDMWVAFNNIVIRVNQINQLRMRQVRNSIPCVLSALESYDVAGSILTADQLFVTMSVSKVEEGPDGNPLSPPAGNSNFGRAIQALSDSLQPPFPSTEYKAMINTILDNSLANALVQLKAARFEDYSPDTCDGAEDPIGGYITVISGLRLPNASQVVGECIANPNPPLPIAFIDQQVQVVPDSLFLDWQNSFIGNRLESALGTSEGGSVLNSFLVGLANTSGTPLADAFFLETYRGEPNVVSMQIPLNEDNFLFGLLDQEPLIYGDNTIIPGFRFEASTLLIRGINKFLKGTELFKAVDRFLLEFYIEFDAAFPLDIQIDGFFEADESFRGGTGNTKIREDWSIDTEITGLQFAAQLLAAVNLDIFANLSLGHFFDVTEGDLDIVLNAFADECLFSCFYEDGINVTALNLSVTSLVGPIFKTVNNNYFSSEFETVVNETLILATKFYLDALPNIMQNCVRTYINDNLQQKWTDSQNGACPTDPENTPLPEEDQYFRFGTSRGLQRFQDFMQENFYANDYQVFNDVVRATTIGPGSQPATLYSPPNELGFKDFTLRYNDVPYGTMDLTISDVKVTNADTFSEVAIVEPVTTVDNYTARSGFVVGSVDRNNDQVIDGLTIDFTFTVDTQDVFLTSNGVLRNELDVTIQFENFTTFIEIFALLNTTEALKVRFSSVNSFNEIPCVLAPFDALTPNSFNLTLDGLIVSFECGGVCQFPLLSNLATGSRFSTADSEFGRELGQLFNDAIQYFVDYVTSSSAQSLIDAQLATAEESCAQLLGLITTLITFNTSADFNVAQVMGIAFAGTFAVGMFGSFLLIPLHQKRKIATLTKFKMKQKLMTEDKERLLLENEMKSLFDHPATSKIAKFVVPVFCLAHIVGLVFAITGPAINIVIQFVILGATTQQIVLVPFSVVSTINDIWNSGAWPLALLIGLASCAWPIIKNAMLFVIWFCPTTILPRPKRATYLTVLDVIGKWSFLDVFIVVMTLAALRTYLRLSAYSRLSFLPEEAFQVDVNVTPEYGIVLLCIIASSSLVINHVQTFYHGKAERANQYAEDVIRGFSGKAPSRATKRTAIVDHYFAGSDRRGRRKRVSPNKVKILIAINLASGLMVLIGVILPVITFTMAGLIGLLLAEVDTNLAKRTYSIIDLGAIVSEAPADDVFGYVINTFFQLLFFLNSVVFPMLQVIMNTLMLTLKLTLKEAKSFYWLTLIVSFWAALECFIVAIVMTIIEIKQITVYIVNFISDDLCQNIQGLLTGILGEANGQCLDVKGFLEPLGTFLLFVGVFIQLVVTWIVIMLVGVVLEDRYFQSYNGLRRVEKPRKPGFLKKATLRSLTKITRGKPKNRRGPSQQPPGGTGSINLNSVALSQAPTQSGTTNPLEAFYNSGPGVEEDQSQLSTAVKNPMHAENIEV